MKRPAKTSGTLKVVLSDDADGAAKAKIYVVSEISVRAIHINIDSKFALNDEWRDREEVFTHIALLHLDYSDLSYEEQARFEVLGKYITAAKGRDCKSELWSLQR